MNLQSTGLGYLFRDLNMALFKVRRDFHLMRARHKGEKDAKSLFTRIYEQNLFGDPESRSGRGSSLTATRTVRAALPGIIERYGIGSMLDIPCGDYNWMRTVDLGQVAYIGADIVDSAVADLTLRHGDATHSFVRLDARNDKLPKVDLIFCRDLFMHLPNADIAAVLANFKRSGSRYLCSTNFPGVQANADTHIGGFRPFSLEAAPFDLPPPLETIADDDFSKRWGRSISIWPVSALR